MNRKSEELKEKQISEVMLSIENRVRHAYNQGYEQGLKASKQEPILDEIKAEIRELATFDTVDVLVEVNRIIDKYRAESEEE